MCVCVCVCACTICLMWFAPGFVENKLHVLELDECMYLSHAEVLRESLHVNLLLPVALLHSINNRLLLNKLRLDTTTTALRLGNLERNVDTVCIHIASLSLSLSLSLPPSSPEVPVPLASDLVLSSNSQLPYSNRGTYTT